MDDGTLVGTPPLDDAGGEVAVMAMGRSNSLARFYRVPIQLVISDDQASDSNSSSSATEETSQSTSAPSDESTSSPSVDSQSDLTMSVGSQSTSSPVDESTSSMSSESVPTSSQSAPDSVPTLSPSSTLSFAPSTSTLSLDSQTQSYSSSTDVVTSSSSTPTPGIDVFVEPQGATVNIALAPIIDDPHDEITNVETPEDSGLSYDSAARAVVGTLPQDYAGTLQIDVEATSDVTGDSYDSPAQIIVVPDTSPSNSSTSAFLSDTTSSASASDVQASDTASSVTFSTLR